MLPARAAACITSLSLYLIDVAINQLRIGDVGRVKFAAEFDVQRMF